MFAGIFNYGRGFPSSEEAANIGPTKEDISRQVEKAEEIKKAGDTAAGAFKSLLEKDEKAANK